MDVGLDEPAAVHVRVGLDRRRRASPIRSVDSRSSAAELARGQRRGDPAQRAPAVAGPASSCDLRRATPSSTPAAASGSASRHGSATPSVLERVEHLVLGVGGVERDRARCASARVAAPRAGASTSSSRLLALDARLRRTRPSVEPSTSSASARSAGGALGGRGRVVELVREPGGHRAERREPLAVLLDRGERGSSTGRTCAHDRGGAPGGGRARARRSRSAGISAHRAPASSRDHAHAEPASR